MRFDVVTLFPEVILTYAKLGMVGKASSERLLTVKVHDLRPFGEGRYHQVDDRPFGGGAGMVLMFEPMARCLESIKAEYAKAGISKYRVLATTAGGKLYKQSTSKTIAREFEIGQLEAIIILCGRYEGFDQRILDELIDEEFSIGNYVLTGGELAALVLVDSVTRLQPGVLNKQESFEHDSFYQDDETIQYPQYTRPELINYQGKELIIPPVLLSGHHAEIAAWRSAQQRKRNHD